MRTKRLFVIALIAASAACSGTEAITATQPGSARAAKGGNGSGDGAATSTVQSTTYTTRSAFPADTTGTTEERGGFLGSDG